MSNEMLYKDSRERINGLNKTADLFAAKGYPNTEKSIREFAAILQGDRVPPDFLKILDLLLDTHQKEFTMNLPVGQDFRNRCFGELRSVIITSIGRMKNGYAPALLTIYPVFERLKDSKRISGLVAGALKERAGMDKSMVFHLCCYAYLVFVEGVFDELARILYFHVTIQKGNVPMLADIEEIDVRTARKKFEELTDSAPVFLEDWETKNHIRNAIAHARAEYDPDKNLARFVDIYKGSVTYDSGFVQLEKFITKFQEIEDSVNAFTYILLLLKVYDYVLAPSEYI